MEYSRLLSFFNQLSGRAQSRPNDLSTALKVTFSLNNILCLPTTNHIEPIFVVLKVVISSDFCKKLYREKTTFIRKMRFSIQNSFRIPLELTHFS